MANYARSMKEGGGGMGVDGGKGGSCPLEGAVKMKCGMLRHSQPVHNVLNFWRVDSADVQIYAFRVVARC